MTLGFFLPFLQFELPPSSVAHSPVTVLPTRSKLRAQQNCARCSLRFRQKPWALHKLRASQLARNRTTCLLLLYACLLRWTPRASRLCSPLTFAWRVRTRRARCRRLDKCNMSSSSSSRRMSTCSPPQLPLLPRLLPPLLRAPTETLALVIDWKGRGEGGLGTEEEQSTELPR